MARVTVEDCIDKIPNRFELVLLSGHRARTISAGAQIAVERDNDKNPVVALREIADEKIACDDLREDFIHSMHLHFPGWSTLRHRDDGSGIQRRW